MLESILSDKRIRFSAATSWEEAVQEAAKPLVTDGSVESRYVDAIIANVLKPGGTYMDLGFGFMLAHARPEAGVIRTAVGLLVLEEGVLLAEDPKHEIKVVILLAASDASSHQSTMASIATILTDEERRNKLLAATTTQDVREAIAD